MGNGQSVLSKTRCCLELTIATEFVSVLLIHLNSENNVFCVWWGGEYKDGRRQTFNTER